jgi:transmembrane sensor
MTRRSDRIETEAARWVLRREEGPLSSEDAEAFEAWLAQNTAHRVAYYRLEYGWNALDRSVAHDIAAAGSPRRLGWSLTAAATVILALASVTLLFSNRHGAVEHVYSTPVGGREVLALRDGSRVELNTDTKLRTDVTPQSRAVWLDRGEAYFEVAHDQDHPFVVYAGRSKVTVLGTKFSVRVTGDQVVVAVLEGRVRVDPDDAQTSATEILTHGDEAIAQGNSTIIAPKSDARVAAALSWRQGLVTFNRETLVEVAAEFNRYNQKKLIIAPTVADIRIGGVFDAENVDVFARLLERAYGMKIDDSGAEIHVSQ